MKIKIVSDIHCDVNKTTSFGFNTLLDKVDLTLIAGDIGGSYDVEMSFLDKLKTNKPVICVGGNHLGYNYLWDSDSLNPCKGTKQDSIDRLRYKYSGENNIYYLENEYVKIQDKVIFGGTMYTDFNLYGNSELYKSCGERGLNDFRYVHIYSIDNVDDAYIRPISGDDYIKWFKIFISKLEKCIEETTEDIIVLSHFAPSIKSISSKYNGKYKNLNPSYASNLEQFILDNPRIKLWIHGHMHDKFDYKIGQCRVVCYPYGYYLDSFIKPSEYIGRNILF